jgi:predicted ATPase
MSFMSLMSNMSLPSSPEQADPAIAAEPVAEATRLSSYVSAERLGPRDTLGASSVSIEELSVGCYGQYVAQVLAVLGHKEISEARRTPSPHKEATLADLLHQTEWWTGRIVRPIELEATWFPNSMVTRLRFKTPGIRSEWTRPPNMGFGVSYALPVIVAGLVAPAGATLIIENPEAHLHPAGQSEVGRFLAHVAADGVQVIVETHSDHVLNGIRRAVADPDHPITSADAKLLFFLAEADQRGVFESLDISPAGAISGWPEGFFDQLDHDLRALTDLARRRGRRP